MYFILIKSKQLKENHLVMHNLHTVNFDIKIKNMLLSPLKEFIDEFKGY